MVDNRLLSKNLKFLLPPVKLFDIFKFFFKLDFQSWNSKLSSSTFKISINQLKNFELQKLNFRALAPQSPWHFCYHLRIDRESNFNRDSKDPLICMWKCLLRYFNIMYIFLLCNFHKQIDMHIKSTVLFHRIMLCSLHILFFHSMPSIIVFWLLLHKLKFSITTLKSWDD